MDKLTGVPIRFNVVVFDEVEKNGSVEAQM